jgi:hypothetical protein
VRLLALQMDVFMSFDDAGGVRTVRIAGRLVAPASVELERLSAGAPAVRLDVSELVSADEEGLCVLESLCEGGAELVGTPPFIALLLQARRTGTETDRRRDAVDSPETK